MGEKKLILVGGGGHCKAIIDVAISAGRSILGIIDNALPTGSSVLDIPVIGNDDNLSDFICDNVEFIITVGQIKTSAIRHKLAEKIIQAGGKLATPIIADTAHIAAGVNIGQGTVIMHNTVINSDSSIGENTIINTGAIVEHDCKVGNFVHVSTGAIINGASTIENDTFIGSHATIANVIHIAKDSIIGAGSVVIHDITQSGTYCGIPAKPIK